jgi:hypothetical protein
MAGRMGQPAEPAAGDLDDRYYNTERAHTGRWTRGCTPEAVLGKARLWQRKR